MAKVIVERPRLGGGVRRPKGCRKREVLAQLDQLPSREGIKRRWHGASYQKSLNEHLTPLRRYLQSQVGRPWNKVHSEISRHLRLDSAVQSHVLDHLADYVEQHVLWIEGQMCSSTGWHVGRPLWKPFYVCPRTGLLRANKTHYRRFRRQKPTIDYVVIDAQTQLHQIDGLWFEVRLAPFAQGCEQKWDVVRKCLACECERYRTYGGNVYAVSKRQLNKREVQRAERLLAECRKRPPR